jgi:hypothetical protein
LPTSQFLLDEEILGGGVVDGAGGAGGVVGSVGVVGAGGVVGCVLLLGVRELLPLEVSEVEGGVVCDLGVSSAIG